jgi:diguanylate cyclase (GGDEF)-like protein
VDRVPTSTVTAQFAFFLVVLGYVVATLKSALERADELARTDYLTGAANFRSFAEMVNAELHRARRYARPFTVCYLDVDYFKIVNDRFGHSTGDALLRVIVDTTRSRTRASDVVARLGGDEFAILLPETGYEAAQAVVAKLRESLLEAVRQRGWPVTFSIGVVTCLEPPDSVDALLQAADGLMYSVKNTTKDSVNHVVLGKPPAA